MSSTTAPRVPRFWEPLGTLGLTIETGLRSVNRYSQTSGPSPRNTPPSVPFRTRVLTFLDTLITPVTPENECVGKGYHPYEGTKVRLGTTRRQDGVRRDERHQVTTKERLKVVPKDLLEQLLVMIPFKYHK